MRRRDVLAFSGAALIGAAGARAETSGFSQAAGALGRERRFAEGEAALLKFYAPDDVEGHLLYAQARAEFDGLIEQLEADLAQSREPAIDGAFHTRLLTAIEARTSFTRHAQTVLTAKVPAGAKGTVYTDLAAALAKAVPDLVREVFSGGLSIWREFQHVDKDRRDDMKNRLEAVRWMPFADIKAES